MITKLFYFDLSGKNFGPKISLKNFKQKLRYQVVIAEALRVEAIQKKCRFYIPAGKVVPGSTEFLFKINQKYACGFVPV